MLRISGMTDLTRDDGVNNVIPAQAGNSMHAR